MVSKFIIAMLMVFSLPVTVNAQILASPNERRVADAISWGTAITAVALDTKASWDSPNRKRALIMEGVRIGTTYTATSLIKHFVPDARPCAPSACGIDDPNSNIPSAHTWVATQTMGGPRFEITIPLVVGTGAGRYLAWKHDTKGILLGAAGGFLTSLIR